MGCVEPSVGGDLEGVEGSHPAVGPAPSAGGGWRATCSPGDGRACLAHPIMSSDDRGHRGLPTVLLLRIVADGPRSGPGGGWSATETVPGTQQRVAASAVLTPGRRDAVGLCGEEPFVSRTRLLRDSDGVAQAAAGPAHPFEGVGRLALRRSDHESNLHRGAFMGLASVARPSSRRRTGPHLPCREEPTTCCRSVGQRRDQGLRAAPGHSDRQVVRGGRGRAAVRPSRTRRVPTTLRSCHPGGPAVSRRRSRGDPLQPITPPSRRTRCGRGSAPPLRATTEASRWTTEHGGTAGE